MKTLSIDIETYSSVSLQKSGVYRYVEAPDFEILLFGYSIDGAPVNVIDLTSGEKIPEDILARMYPQDVPGTHPMANRDFHTMYVGEIVDAYIIR